MYLTRLVPLIGALRGYRRGDLPRDFVAGVAVGVVTVPQAIAYALLAGLPAQAGLYASLAPMVIYGVFGSSRQLVVGPVAIAALMVAAAVGKYAPAYSEEYVGIAIVLSLEAGLMLWLLRLLRVGNVVNLLSRPLIAGFVNAAAVLVIVSQLSPFAGLEVPRAEDPLRQLLAVFAALEQTRPAALAIGLASAAALVATPLACRRWLGRDHTLARCGPVLVAVGATAAVTALNPDVATVGFVPPGLPSVTVPLFDAALWRDLALHAALIALIAYVESYSIGKTLATRQLQRVDANQELVALGAANVAAAFSGAYPVAGSFARSAINLAAGARTQVSALVCAVVIVATLWWLTPLFQNLPRAALAAIVIVSVFSVMDFRSLGEHWRFHRPDVIAHWATFGAVLTLGVAAGLCAGLAVSLALFMRGASRPHIAVLGRLGDSAHFRNVDRFATRTWPHLVAARVDESLCFANADQVEDRLARLAAGAETRPEGADPSAAEREGLAPRKEARHLVLVMTAVNFVDTTGLEMLERLAARLERDGVTLHLCELKGPVRDQFDHVALDAWLTGRVFRTTDDAFRALAGDAEDAGSS